jgi:hypothetical protein
MKDLGDSIDGCLLKVSLYKNMSRFYVVFIVSMIVWEITVGMF